MASGYFGIRVGQKYELNQICCGVSRGHDLAISVRETLGLLRFPSQIGQDRWVGEAVFPGVRNGYFLDVGSADGFINSNTWALEQRGWTGICIDPFPSNMAGRRCRVFQEAVDGEGGRNVTFAKAGELGGITDYLDRYKETVRTASTVQLTTVTLRDILERAHAPTFIHFMSLDIEGAELEALRGFPFDRYTLGALAVEHNYEEPKRSEIDALLNSKGYMRARTWMQDDFYLPRQLR
jgi:FkbM family methyltransferase